MGDGGDDARLSLLSTCRCCRCYCCCYCLSLFREDVMLEGHDISVCVVKVLRSRRLFRSMSHHLLRGFHEVSREGAWRQGNGGRKGGGGFIKFYYHT